MVGTMGTSARPPRFHGGYRAQGREKEGACGSMGDFQSAALQVLWQAVTSDPMNFQSWTALLSQVGTGSRLMQAMAGFFT